MKGVVNSSGLWNSVFSKLKCSSDRLFWCFQLAELKKRGGGGVKCNLKTPKVFGFFIPVCIFQQVALLFPCFGGTAECKGLLVCTSVAEWMNQHEWNASQNDCWQRLREGCIHCISAAFATDKKKKKEVGQTQFTQKTGPGWWFQITATVRIQHTRHGVRVGGKDASATQRE